MQQLLNLTFTFSEQIAGKIVVNDRYFNQLRQPT